MGYKVVYGVNDLETYCKKNDLLHVLDEWNYKRNSPFKPADFAAKSNKKVWWKCRECNGEWEAAINPRTSKSAGCPYCSGRKASITNNLLESFPEIASQWNYDKNLGKAPKDFTPKSNQQVWWKCEKGHEWKASITSRTRLNAGCPYCSGNRILKGYNDLQTLYPGLLIEWNFEKNKTKPSDIGVAKPVWWKCKKGHEWMASALTRISGSGCPYCSGRLAVRGENDLQTINPQLAKEWNYEKNGKRTPQNVKANSHYKVWWKCDRGHEWQAIISDRNKGNGCPICSGVSTSLAEQGVAFYLSQIYSIEQRKRINGYEVDIFIPEYRIAIEYDGIFYHSGDASQKREEKKNKALLEAGIVLYRIKESYDRSEIVDKVIYYAIDTHFGNSYSQAIDSLIWLLSNETGVKTKIDVNAKRDALKIRERSDLNSKSNSFQARYPELAKEWDYNKNGTLSPDLFSPRSPQKVWWLCNKGHSFQASLDDRAGGSGCPYCSNRKLLKGFNDLKTWCTNNDMSYVLAEWDYDKNDKDPSEYSPKSHKKVWWMCPNGHSYQAVISNHTGAKSGCPICNNTLLLEGFNDLQTRFPELLAEWDYEKNDLLPNAILSGSHKKVWWKCEKGHQWFMEVSKRTTKDARGCPICGRKQTSLKLSKAVINLDTGEIYESIAEARKKTGIDNISNCCLGKYKSAGGFRWAFCNSDEKKEM